MATEGDRFGFYFDSLWSTVVGSVIATLITIYLVRPHEAQVPDGFASLRIFRNLGGLGTIGASVALTMAVNLAVSAGCAFAIYRLMPGAAQGSDLGAYITTAMKGGVKWGLLQFTCWGVLVVFWQAWITRSLNPNPIAFANAGLLGGALLLPVATIGVWLIGEHLLKVHDATQIYALEPRALLRLYLPSAMLAVAYGLIFGYFILGLGGAHPIAQLFAKRWQVFALLCLILMIFLTVTWNFKKENVVWEALAHNNVLKVWGPYIIVYAVSFLAGFEVFERIALKYAYVFLNKSA